MLLHRLLFAFVVLAGFLPQLATAGPPRLIGGTLSWRLLFVEAGPVIEATVELGLKRSLYSGTAPDGKPAVGDSLFDAIGADSSVLSFGDGFTDGSLVFTVESIDPTDDWLVARASRTHGYTDFTPYTLSFTGCCSFSTPGTLALTSKYDPGRANSSPATSFPMVIHCVLAPTCTVPTLFATEEPNKLVAYRLATMAESGFAAPPGVTVNNLTGVVTVSSPFALSSVQVVAELFDVVGGLPSGTALSSSSLEVRAEAVAGADLPIEFRDLNLTGPDSLCGKVVGLTTGQLFTHIFKPYSLGANLVLNIIGVPLSLRSISSTLPASFTTTNSTTLTFTPDGPGTFMATAVVRSASPPYQQRFCSIGLTVFPDDDQDSIPDTWERFGYFSNGQFVNLPAMGATPNRKNVFVYVNGYTEPKTLTQSLVSKTAIEKVVQAFANSPKTNPDLSTGVKVTVVYGDLTIPYVAADGPLAPTGTSTFDWTRFDSIKAARMPAAYRGVFRYALFFPFQGGPAPTSTGIARGIPSNDFVITLGSVPRTSRLVPIGTTGRFAALTDTFGGTDEQQTGTFMHEFGHALGLTHGGPDVAVDSFQKTLTYKPNYLSVMNYSYQLPGIPTTGSTPIFDYSQYDSFDIGSLDENNLNETLGFQIGPLGFQSGIGTRSTAIERGLLGAWYCQTNNTRRTACRDANGVLLPNCNLNTPQNFSCGTTPFLSSVMSRVRQSATAGTESVLQSANDWAFLDFRGGVNAGGVIGLDPIQTIPTDIYNPQPELLLRPNPPTGMTGRRTGTSVRLAWNPVGTLNSVNYTLYKRIGALGDFTPISNTAAATYTDTVAAGQTVQYYVTASSQFNGGDGAAISSAPSTIVTVVVP